MKENKIFDGITFVHSVDDIKRRTDYLTPLFKKIQGEDYEPTDEELWDLQIKVAEFKDKFIYVHSLTDYDIYLFYNNVDKEGNYIWTYDFNHDICYEDNNGVINKLEKLNAPKEFIKKFLDTYYNILYSKDIL